MSEWTLPDGVIPGVAPIGLILIRTDELAIAVSSVAAYPNGFEFTVHALLHHEQLTWGISPIDPAADPVTKQYPNKLSGSASSTPTAAGPGATTTSRCLWTTPTARTWS